MKVTLAQAWVHPERGSEYPAGTTFRCTPDLYNELKEGGYLDAPQEVKKAAPRKKQTKQIKK